jgi:energy-coupling factor transport system permease protein
MGRDEFAGYHPVVNFAFFCAVIACGVLFLHPAFVGIAFFGALGYATLIQGKKIRRLMFFFLLPMMVLAVVINALVNRHGTNFLFYLGDEPITMESVIFGVVTAFMLATIILWFTCYTKVMTSDKFMFLFGRIIPAASLIFSMVLRFVPRFMAQAKVISDGQKCIGRDVTSGKLRNKVSNGMRILSMLTTWAMENAMDTADTMKSRGYGLPKRTSYTLYRFDKRDGIACMGMAVILAVIIVGEVSGRNTLIYFPEITFHPVDWQGVIVYFFYFVLCFIPLFINLGENYRWKHLQSKI